MQIVPYDFIDAERLQFGHYPVLDTILYRWTRRVEETLFEQVGVEAYAGASVFEEMRFATFFTTLRRPRPIYFFDLAPLQGTSLFVVDNRFAAFCLRHGSGAGRESKLTPTNQARLQRIVQVLLAEFAACWADVQPVEARLRKVTTYPFRARVRTPHEMCLVAQVHLAGANLSSRFTWCLPLQMLEPVQERLRERTVIPPLQMEARGERLSEESVLRWLNYGVQVRMGQMSIAEAASGLAVGAVLPLESEAGPVVEVEGRPVLRASMGQVEGHYAFHVDGRYEPPQRSRFVDPRQFRPVQWPAATGE